MPYQQLMAEFEVVSQQWLITCHRQTKINPGAYPLELGIAAHYINRKPTELKQAMIDGTIQPENRKPPKAYMVNGNLYFKQCDLDAWLGKAVELNPTIEEVITFLDQLPLNDTQKGRILQVGRHCVSSYRTGRIKLVEIGTFQYIKQLMAIWPKKRNNVLHLMDCNIDFFDAIVKICEINIPDYTPRKRNA